MKRPHIEVYTHTHTHSEILDERTNERTKSNIEVAAPLKQSHHYMKEAMQYVRSRGHTLKYTHIDACAEHFVCSCRISDKVTRFFVRQ